MCTQARPLRCYLCGPATAQICLRRRDRMVFHSHSLSSVGGIMFYTHLKFQRMRIVVLTLSRQAEKGRLDFVSPSSRQIFN
jgi:hypothetical protein